MFFKPRLPHRFKEDIAHLQKQPFGADFWKLERHEWQLLFVPGTFKAVHPRHEFLAPYVRKGRMLSQAWTDYSNLVLWKKCLGQETFTIPLFNHFKTIPQGRICGELYAVRPRAIYDLLDNYYHNGVEFRRDRVKVIVPYHQEVYGYRIENGRKDVHKMITPEFVQYIQCWMYTGISSYWEDKLDGGLTYKPVVSYMPSTREGKWNSERYYLLTGRDYFDKTAAPDNEPIPRREYTNDELLEKIVEGVWHQHS